MTSAITIIGFGPVGRAAAVQATRAGHTVTVAQRSAPHDLPPGVRFAPCDVLDPESVARVCADADQVVLAIGFSYTSTIWRGAWPRAIANVLAACARRNARLVFVDNLYMYGPQTAPLREDMASVDFGAKPAVRAAVTRLWMAEASAGRVKVAALRAPDFYGPGVLASHLGEVGFKAVAEGKAAMLIAPPDTPHAYAYVPDFGRAVATMLDAPDDCFGQAWHVPCPPTTTSRAILALGAAAIGRRLRINAMPLALLPALGLVSPIVRELAEMRFQWDRPYHVDWSKFAARFWSDPTPHEIAAAETARAFASADAIQAQRAAA